MNSAVKPGNVNGPAAAANTAPIRLEDADTRLQMNEVELGILEKRPYGGKQQAPLSRTNSRRLVCAHVGIRRSTVASVLPQQ